jgi:glutaminyl-tRNA synthetase
MGNDNDVTSAAPATPDAPAAAALNFIQERITQDVRADKNGGRVVTRFPPEPNGYLHIGHSKSICLNFGLALEFDGVCHLRFDDTNPVTEDTEYTDSIERDVKWLGFDWGKNLFYASDYFEQLYGFAVELIKRGKAYVDSRTTEEIQKTRGDFTTPGTDSPFRNRSVDENLDVFARMRAGEFKDGEHVLRAKIDMASSNQNLRDPLIYRIRHAHHHRTGNAWCIYPLYDFAHGYSDMIEGITHSICTLEFENHRPLYDWFIEAIGSSHHPQQIEFARLNLTYAVMSKRKILKLVQEGHVSGWDDPRMLTLSGLRRRGYTPASLRALATSVGVSKNDSWIDMSVLEGCVREDLNANASRAMAVLAPLKVTIENYAEDAHEFVDVPNHPQKPELGTRKVRFSRELFIERDDFQEVPVKGFFRLAPGKEVRLRSAYFITCTSVVKDAAGNITELRCTYDPATKGGDSPDGRKVKGTLHWVDGTAPTTTVRLYDRLFAHEHPGTGDADFLTQLNPKSCEVISDARVEPMLVEAASGATFQFERTGYFCVDCVDSKPGAPIFNRVVGLKDSWAKQGK